MTLDQMLIEVFDNMGRPTDVSPLDKLDDNSTLNPDLWGYKQLQSWINQGYKAITTWRTPNGRFYRHNDMVDRRYIQWGPHVLEDNMDLTDKSADGYTTGQHLYTFPDDSFYVGNQPPAMVLLTLDGLGDLLEFQEVEPETTQFQALASDLEYWQVYETQLDADWSSLAYFVDEHTLYTLRDLPWVIPITVGTVYERGINWARYQVAQPLNDLYAIRQLRVIDGKHDMEIASRTENFTQNLAEVGRPNEYWREGRYIYFDKHVDQDYTIQLEYYKEANPLVLGTDVPVIPERYHTPIVYWASQRALLRQGENADAYSFRGFLDQEMRSIIKEQDLDVERYESNFISGNMSGGHNYG
jgi:hypothetical protein